MPLSPQAFKDIEQVVGKGNVSDDSSTVMSYGWNAGLGGMPKPKRLAEYPPVAVVLPGSTEEVQGLVKACLKHGLKFKAHSTGYGSFAGVTSPNTISVDLRRMNKIHEIDEQNQMAIIDPYVTTGQLQAEAMKRGLNCHIVGAGLTHSPLASATACFGIGITGTTTGNNVRNLLGLEWVTPEGEILKIGTPGSGCGWFSDEGPGPGFRGMIRGVSGTMGELGIFTRIGYKLYSWPGPKAVEDTGKHPQLGMKIPEHFKLYHMEWNNWEDVTKATYDINRSGVAYILVRIPPNSYGLALSPTNNDFYKLYESGQLPEIAQDTDAHRHTWTMLTAASSAAEADYKEKVVKGILERTGGRIVNLKPEHAALVARFLVTSIYIPRVLRPSSAMSTSFGVLDSFAQLPAVMKAGEKCIKDNLKPGGLMMQGEREEFWSWPNERRHLWTENAFSYDVNIDESRGAVLRMALEHDNMMDVQGNMGFAAFALGPLADFFYIATSGANTWMRKIKKKFDKHGTNDALNYIPLEAPWITKYWPILRKLAFFRPFRPILTWTTTYLAKVGLHNLMRPSKSK